MEIIHFLVIGFVLIGFIICASFKRSMESKIAFIKGNMNSSEISTKPIIGWIIGTTTWGIVSIILVVWSFSI